MKKIVLWSMSTLTVRVLLCGYHHDVAVHRQGFQLVLSPDRTLTVRTRDDIPVPHFPGLPPGRLDELAGPVYRSGATSDRLDLDYAVSVLLQQAA